MLISGREASAVPYLWGEAAAASAYYFTCANVFLLQNGP